MRFICRQNIDRLTLSNFEQNFFIQSISWSFARTESRSWYAHKDRHTLVWVTYPWVPSLILQLLIIVNRVEFGSTLSKFLLKIFLPLPLSILLQKASSWQKNEIVDMRVDVLLKVIFGSDVERPQNMTTSSIFSST